MKKLARVTTALMLAAVVLAGCGGDEKSTGDPQNADPSTTESDPIAETDWGKPATGPVISGDGYTYRAPKGWRDVTRGARSVQSMVDSAASEKAATGGFAEQYNKGAKSLPGVLSRSKSISTAEILSAGVVAADQDNATVLVATRGTVINTATEGKKAERNLRLQLDLKYVDGKWLTSDLQFVG